MNLQEITQELRNMISTFKKSNEFAEIETFRFFARSIEIAINLTELAIDNKRAILDSEKYWFTGGYLISYTMNGEWENISILYDKMVDEVKANSFFSSMQ